MPRLERLIVRAARDAWAARPRRSARHANRYANVVLASLVVAVLLTGTGSLGGTFAFLKTQTALASNGVATAKLFALTDVTALAQPAGKVLISWSDVSWASAGYSIRRGTVITGPFAQVGTAAAGVVTYTDSTGTNGTTYYYVVRGLSGLGGSGVDSSVVSAVVDSTAPTVSLTIPAEAATGVSTATSIEVDFSSSMNQAVSGNTFALVACNNATCSVPGAAATGTLTWLSNAQLYFTPDFALNTSVWYGIKLTTTATDFTGNALSNTGCPHVSGSTCYRTFQTGVGSAASGITAAVPGNGTTAVGTNGIITMLFTSNLSGTAQFEATVGLSLKQINGAGSPCYVYAGNGQTPLCAQNGGAFNAPTANGGQFIPTNPLKTNTQYTFAEVYNDPANLVVNYTATFTTGAGTDSTKPTVSQVVPNSNATGVVTSTKVQLTFSEQMDPITTAPPAAFTLKAFPVGPTCSGALGGAVAGTGIWTTSSILTFIPTSALTGNQCYQIGVANTARDSAANTMLANYTSNFTTLNGAAPTVTPVNGTVFFQGALQTVNGAGWIAGAVKVIPKWEDGTVLDAVGAAVPAGTFTNYSFNIPTTATAGTHTVNFTQVGGATISQLITVHNPSSVALSASATDIAAGGTTTITATAFDGGVAAVNASISLTITIDAGLRGSLSTPSRRAPRPSVA